MRYKSKWVLRNSGTFPTTCLKLLTRKKKKKLKSTKRMTGVDEDFLGCLQIANVGWVQQQRLNRELAMSGMEDDKMRGARGCAVGEPTVLNTGSPPEQTEPPRSRKVRDGPVPTAPQGGLEKVADTVRWGERCGGLHGPWSRPQAKGETGRGTLCRPSAIVLCVVGASGSMGQGDQKQASPVSKQAKSSGALHEETQQGLGDCPGGLIKQINKGPMWKYPADLGSVPCSPGPSGASRDSSPGLPGTAATKYLRPQYLFRVPGQDPNGRDSLITVSFCACSCPKT